MERPAHDRRHRLDLTDDDLRTMDPHHPPDGKVARLFDRDLTPHELTRIRTIVGTNPKKHAENPETEIHHLRLSLDRHLPPADVDLLIGRIERYLAWRNGHTGPRNGDSSTIEAKAFGFITKYRRGGLTQKEYHDIVRAAVGEAAPWVDLGAGPRRVSAELKRSLERLKRSGKRAQETEAGRQLVGPEEDPRVVQATAFEQAHLVQALERINKAFPHALKLLSDDDHDAIVMHHGLQAYGVHVRKEANRFRHVDEKTVVLSLRKVSRRIADVLRASHGPEDRPDPIQQAALAIVEKGLLAEAIAVSEQLKKPSNG